MLKKKTTSYVVLKGIPVIQSPFTRKHYASRLHILTIGLLGFLVVSLAQSAVLKIPIILSLFRTI